jgi:hypothetical protein
MKVCILKILWAIFLSCNFQETKNDVGSYENWHARIVIAAGNYEKQAIL